MGIQILSIISLLVIVTLATGQFCYKCEGGKVDSTDAKVTAALKTYVTNPKCQDDVKSQPNCTSLAGNYCSKNVETLKGKIEGVDVVLTLTKRDCESKSKPKKGCKDMDSGTTKITGLTSTMMACICEGNLCNGQTTIAPTVVTCLLSLVLAVYAMF